MKLVISLTAVLVLVACDKRSSPKPTPPPATADAGPVEPPAAPDAAPPEVIVPSTPQALWRAYQAAHAGASKATALEVGRTIDALLSREASAIIAEAAATMAAKLPASAGLKVEEIRYKLLGEGAASRAAQIARATVEFGPDGDTVAFTARDGATTLEFVAVRDGDQWRLGPSPSLLVAEDDLFALPAGQVATVGAATPEAVAARWVDALNSGTGWDAYNLVAPSNRARLKAMIAEMGGSGDEDVVRVFDKTIRDRRDRGITALPATVPAGGDERRTIEFRYSDGTTDQFDAVREDGAWWIVMPL